MPTPDLVEALIWLTRDEDPRVRDWACFSLAGCDNKAAPGFIPGGGGRDS